MASHVLDWQQLPPESCRRGAVAIGNFDGAHLGHAALVAELAARARAAGGPAVALTFDPHPLALLRPGEAPPLLTTPRDRAELLLGLGADEVVTLGTTPALLGLRAAEFFEEVVIRRLAARAMVEGKNFGFGRGREGDITTLERLCQAAGVPLRVVPPVQLEGGEVSSSRVRAALLDGDVGLAGRLLGRPYRLRGVVGHGQRRGRTIGYPTANLEGVATVVPRDGVYAAWAGGRWAAAVNIGPSPTFGEERRRIEAHLIGYSGDLYGRELALDVVARLRDTRAFAGVGELVAQLGRDVEAAGRALGEGG